MSQKLFFSECLFCSRSVFVFESSNYAEKNSHYGKDIHRYLLMKVTAKVKKNTRKWDDQQIHTRTHTNTRVFSWIKEKQSRCTIQLKNTKIHLLE